MRTEYAQAIQRDVLAMLDTDERLTYLAAYLLGVVNGTVDDSDLRTNVMTVIIDTLVEYRRDVVERKISDGPQDGDSVMIRECPVGRHVGAAGTVTARDGNWLRVKIEGGSFCEPSQVLVAPTWTQWPTNADKPA